MTIQWRKEMAVDDSVIDEDHKLLIEIVNTFEAAINRKLAADTIDQGLKLLKHYTVEHFRREEELQRSAQYPFFEAHAREHRDVIKKLDGIIAHRRTAANRADISVVAREIIDLLKDWLVHHIIQSDLRMRPYVAQMKAHRQTMRSLKQPSSPCAPARPNVQAAPLSSPLSPTKRFSAA
ncbi:MAG: bacteriohemerythrin [Rhodospirillaceae bacterium]